MQQEIGGASYEYQQSINSGERIIVGVNQYTMDEPPFDKIFTVDDSIRALQVEKLKKLRSERNAEEAKGAIEKVEQVAKDGGNLMPVIIEAVEKLATLGEISDAMRRVFGEYK